MPTRRHVVASGIIGIIGFASVLATALRGEGNPEPQPSPIAGETETPTARSTVEPPASTTSEPTATESPAPTASPTPTPLGEPEPPQVVLVNLLSEWRSIGDVEENAIESIDQGSTAVIGARHETWAHDGTQRATVMVTIDDQRRTAVVEREVSTNGPVASESTVAFDTADWTIGTKSGTVVVRDEITGYVSEPASFQFELT